MSEGLDDSKDRLNEPSLDSICRDFIRGVCDRKFCKYKHENEVRSLNFCHDFQNSTCPRPNCKFIHCTTEDVEEYKRTGEMSNQILAEATRKNQLPGLQPVCNLFRKGTCRRTFCKYRHLTKEEEDAEIMELIQNNNRNRFGTNNNYTEPQYHFASVNGVIRKKPFDDVNDFIQPLPKRRFLSTVEPEFIESLATDHHRLGALFKGYFAGNPPPILSRADARTILLEEDNNLLLKEIAQLKKQVSDLTATNEFLLDQNATLRVSGTRNGTVTVPAVTITNTLPQTNTVMSQQQVIRTVPASVTTVPVSIATVTTCNPVSGNSVTIAGCPAVSIASPAQILAPSQQILVTTNPTTQLAIANSSQAQLAIAQQNLANNLAQAQPQLTSQAQQLALATTTQQLNSQAQHINQQLALATAPQQLTSQPLTLTNNNTQLTLAGAQQSHLTSQAQQLANQQSQLTSQAQQLANQQSHLSSQAQQLANQQQAQLALANTTQQLTSQAQQLAMANTPQQLTVANVSQQLALAGPNQQLLTQQNLASSPLELHRNNQLTISTSQTIAMSNTSQPMVSYPIMTQSINHAMPH